VKIALFYSHVEVWLMIVGNIAAGPELWYL